jgi:Holliday junction resolvase
MSASQRRKGANGERELFKLIAAELGIEVRRELAQTRSGGADTLDVQGWAIEVKRQEKEEIASWWAQTKAQAASQDRRPILFYRRSRQPWRAVVDLADLDGRFEPDEETAIISFSAACFLMRVPR